MNESSKSYESASLSSPRRYDAWRCQAVESRQSRLPFLFGVGMYQRREFLGTAACPECRTWNALSYWRVADAEIEIEESCRCRQEWNGSRWV